MLFESKTLFCNLAMPEKGNAVQLVLLIVDGSELMCSAQFKRLVIFKNIYRSCRRQPKCEPTSQWFKTSEVSTPKNRKARVFTQASSILCVE